MRYLLQFSPILLIVLAGCPEDTVSARAAGFADEACAALFSCDCEEHVYETRDQCVTIQSEYLDADLRIAESFDLRFDQSCFDDALSMIKATACEPSDFFEPPDPASCSSCKFYYGDRVEGEECSNVVDDCEQGLVCDDVCRDPCPLAAEGETCLDDDNFIDCETGLVCDFDSGECVAAPGLGDTCGIVPCGDGVCGVDGVCVQPSQAGEPCSHMGCADGLWCDPDQPSQEGGTCAPVKTAGDPCVFQEECAGYCDEDVCVDIPLNACAG